MDLAVGDVVRERYELLEELGTGGFATVWRARDRSQAREVALKFPRFEAHDRETVLERFDRERRLLEPFADGLSHGTVVRYLDGDLENEPRYIALEFLTGEPLAEAFSSGSLGTAVRERIATDLAETLDFLHRNGVMYLDLKPENVILRRSGRPVLYDFNTAGRTSEPVEMRFGADQFKAPELLGENPDSAAIGPWSDVFSWGKLTFYLLTGVKILPTNVPDDGLDPRSFGASYGDGLAAVVQRATIPDADDRYDDGTALAAAVAEVTGRSPRALVAHPYGTTCAVGDGDTIGRLVGGKPVPWVVLADDRGYVAARHARFVHDHRGWAIEDLSLNGTYVSDGDGWTLVLSERGYRKQCERDRMNPDDPPPPSELTLSPKGAIAPVHPEYGIRLHVRTPDG